MRVNNKNLLHKETKVGHPNLRHGGWVGASLKLFVVKVLGRHTTDSDPNS